MKIVLISNLYEPYARGGAEIIVKRTAKELVKQGHTVIIITAKPWSGLSSLVAEITEEESIKMIRYYPPNLYFYANDYKWPLIVRAVWHLLDIFNFHSAWTVENMLEEEKPDLVITHNLMGLGYFIPRTIKKLGIKHIHVLHDIQLAVRSGVMIKGKEQGFGRTGFWANNYRRLVKWLFDSPDVIVSPSNFLLKYYDDYGYFPKSKKIVLRNPIDEKFFKDGQGNGNSRLNFSFGCVGQLVEHKGLQVLKDAFSQIASKNVNLDIVGDGPMKVKMADWENEDKRIDYKGRIPNKYLPDFFETIDALVLPTLTYENSPTVVCEALASGVPVIVSDVGGAAELVKDMETGIVVKSGDVDELKGAMELMIENHHMMRDAARLSVEGMGVGMYIQKLLDT